MHDSVTQFYDGLAGDYHLIFGDWHESVRGQGEVLDGLLGGGPCSVLDCSCGIGTQALGLALRGYKVHGTDLSPEAVARAGREAAAFGVSVTFGVADVRRLSEQVPGVFDAVIACDNALPHLLTDGDLRRGVAGMAAKLRPGGVFLASIRDYDALVRERPRATPVRVLEGPPCRRAVFQVWDWAADGRTYKVHQFIVCQGESGWETVHHATDYRALLREELDAALVGAGLADVRWNMPQEGGWYQPLVTARKP
jgi:SAM-dependent methyltransferase